jgi:hypothetical protein
MLKTETAVLLSYRLVPVVLPGDEEEHHDMATCSKFIRNRVCDLINKRVRVDLGLRKYLNDVAESILKYCGRVVAPEQIYTHIRYWRARWVHVSRVKRLEDVRWVEETTTIMMNDNAYFAHIMVRSMHLFCLCALNRKI